jgi:hypothetical protein
MERVGPTLQEVLAQNIRKVRQHSALRQDEVATKARAAGLEWTSVTVATIEAGERAIAAEELLLLPIIFDRPLSDFIETEADVVRVSDTAAVLAETLRAVVAGEWEMRPLPTRRAIPYISERRDPKIMKVIKRFRLDENLLTYFLIAEGRRGEAERKAAQSLDSDPTAVTAASIALFGRDLTSERDARAEEGDRRGQDTRARRGHITRTLLTEIKNALAHPSQLDPVEISSETASEKVGLGHEVIRKTSLETDPATLFRAIIKTYAGVSRLSEEDLKKQHRVTIRKTTRKNSP